MIVIGAYVIHCSRWLWPAACMVLPAPVLFGTAQSLAILKPILPKKHYDKLDGWIWGGYQRVLMFFFGSLTGTDLILSGDYEEFQQEENALALSNHQSGSDWILMDMIAMFRGTLGHMRYILKDELKFIPMYGMYFWQHGCVNVSRKSFNEDKAKQQIAYLRDSHTPTMMIVFPEGTRFQPHRLDVQRRSQEFAIKKGFEPLEYCLSPRSRGCRLVLNNMIGHLDVIYDVTIAFDTSRLQTKESGKRGPAPGMIEFITSYSPQVHVHIDRIPIGEVPKEEEHLEKWIHARYVAKDRRLAAFYRGEPLDKSPALTITGAPWTSTLPSTCLLLGTTLLLLSSRRGRQIYSAALIAGTIGSIAFMSFK